MDRNRSELLQEMRIPQTGVQIIGGFLLTLPFQQRFGTLTELQKWWFLFLVVLATMTTGLMLVPVSLNRRLFQHHVKNQPCILKISDRTENRISGGPPEQCSKFADQFPQIHGQESARPTRFDEVASSRKRRKADRLNDHQPPQEQTQARSMNMATVNRTIDVEVPVSVAYNQWTQFESFPEFMKGVEAVEQIDETALHFSTNVGGVKRDYNAQILEQVPDSLVSWASIDGPRNAGSVSFEQLGPDRTRVNVEIEWEPESFAEKAGSLVGIDDLRVSADLDKFKEFIEARGQETGAWRGSVADGDIDDAGDAFGVAITSELPAVDPDLMAPAASTAADGGAQPHVGQYTEGDYGTERVLDLPSERIQGDYTAEETLDDPSGRPSSEPLPGTESRPRPTDH